MTRSTSFILALGLLVAACSSPPTRYFELSPNPPAPRPGFAGLVEIDTVTIPASLDRLQIVREQDSYRVAVLGVERWASPLDDQIRRTLTADLAACVGDAHVLRPGTVPAGDSAVHILVDIDRFGVDSTGRAILAVQWAIVSEGNSVSRNFETFSAEAGSPSVEAVPAAMSRLLGQLSDRVAEQLSRMR
jgi:uncharacterized protein